MKYYSMKRKWEINWDYWEAQIEGYNALKKKKKLWRDYKNENKELIDDLFEWYWVRKNELGKHSKEFR